MRKTVIIVLFITFSTQIEAQQLSIGYKTGVNNWIRVNTTNKGSFTQQIKDGALVSWNNELFIRNQSKGNIALEGGVSYTKRDMDGVYYTIGCFGNTGAKIEPQSISYTELNLGIQYKITTPSCMKCPLLNKFNSYIGVSIHSGLVNEATKYTESYQDPSLIQQEPTIQNNKSIYLSAGLNHTLMYTINKQFNIVSTSSLKFTPDNRYNLTSNTRAGISLGASYNIK